MMLRSSAKPPLARSPIRLRSRRKPLQPAADYVARTPPGSLSKSQIPNRSLDMEQSGLRPEYHTISCELRALAQMVHQELGTKESPSFNDGGALGGRRSPLFERGRMYDEYSARRNERLFKRKAKGEVEGYEKKPAYDLGVRVESAKKRVESTKFDSRWQRGGEARTPRYSLRSTKPPIPMAAALSMEKPVGITERKVRRTTRKA
ncbi:hypothetical protein SASPL_134606 [Salvia splendens]|uniref:Uncharacterized protein n=1 Tax=Salvia splendens TaxID=180675 RepID=A0A8X8WWB2_SALSN|nr:uncharacterized protein LOC121760210 [Salvia splendens]KAG6402413.1 hypothetical protein SASPL_134606 [Salvia splendens]